MFFAQKTPDFGSKNKLRIWEYPPSPPLRIFSAKRGLRIWGVPPPPLRTKSAKWYLKGSLIMSPKSKALDIIHIATDVPFTQMIDM